MLILAGISLSAVFNEKGIFKRAEGAVAKNSKEQAKEVLEMVLADAKMIKYSEGLDEDELNEKLNKIGQIEEKDNTKIIVKGYVWRIDRNSLEIKEFLGEDDGIEISYTIIGNESWTKEAKNITINVTVKNNKGALDTSSIIVKRNETDITKDITINGGNFVLTTTESATYTVSAKNSEGKQSTPKTIKVNAKLDTTAPTVEKVTVESNEMDIKISATGHDKNTEEQEESGIDYFTYKITPTEGIPIGEEQKTFKAGEIVTIPTTVTVETTYTVEVTATDKVGNESSEPKTAETIIVGTITIAEAKEKVNATTLPQYIGAKVKDYTPEGGGTWRVFYYDKSGKYGTRNALYLRRDPDEGMVKNIPQEMELTEQGSNIMTWMNPIWAKSTYNTIDTNNEKMAAQLCEPSLWSEFKDDNASFAIGGPSWEMFKDACKSTGVEPNFNRECEEISKYGYGYVVVNSTQHYFSSRLTNYEDFTKKLLLLDKSFIMCTPVNRRNGDGGSGVAFYGSGREL